MTKSLKYVIIVSNETACNKFDRFKIQQKGVSQMTTEMIKSFLVKLPLFSALNEKEIAALSERSEAAVFSAGQEIKSNHLAHSVKIILSGAVSVTKKNGDKEILMRVVQSGGILGVASVFTDKHESISVITAMRETEVLFISHAVMQALVLKSPAFAESYIRLLTAKIKFLNNRVKAYTSASAESKLAFHILSLDEAQSGRVEVGVSKTALADMLDVGRASLYRALDTLTEKGIIKYEKNVITVLDYEALESVAERRT